MKRQVTVNSMKVTMLLGLGITPNQVLKNMVPDDAKIDIFAALNHQMYVQ